MLDRTLHTLVQGPLMPLGHALAGLGIRADWVTIAGFALGAASFPFLLVQWYEAALLFLILNRVFDGLDGAVARAERSRLPAGTPATGSFGGYLDIVADFAFYGGFVLFFGLGRPEDLGFAAILLAAFYVSGGSFLAYAAIEARGGHDPKSDTGKAFAYAAGLAEGAETILFFALFCLFPEQFGILALIFAALCVVTGLARTALAARRFR